MVRNQSIAAVGLATAVTFTGAAPTVLAQGAIGGALTAPAQAKVAPAAPAATVKAGAGGGPASAGCAPITSYADFRTDNPVLSAALERARTQGVNLQSIWNDRTLNVNLPNAGGVQAMAVPGLGTTAANDPVAAAYRINQLTLNYDAREWPRVPAEVSPAGLNHMGGALNLPDGRVISLERLVSPPTRPPLVVGGGVITSQPVRSNLTVGNAGDATFTYRLVPEGDSVTLYSIFALADGSIVNTPSVSVPSGGGTRTVNMPGGGSLTLTLDGAHAITDAEQASAANQLAILNRVAPPPGSPPPPPPAPPPAPPPPPPGYVPPTAASC